MEKMRIMVCSNTRGNVDLVSLTNFFQVVMPPKFKSPEFVKYDGTGDSYAYLRMFYRKMAPYGDNQPLLYQIFPNSLIGSIATWYVEVRKDLKLERDANAFLDYYRFNIEISPDHIVL